MTIRIPATAFWCDAVKRSADPTGTLDIRKRFGSLCEQRFRKVRGVLQQSIVDRDVLGLNPASTSPIAMAGSPGNKEIAFQTWLDNLLRRMVVEDGAWMRPMIALAYVRAVARAQRLTHSSAVPHDRTETIDVLATLALTELQGICEAVSQSVMRSTLSGWLHNLRPAEVFTQVSRAISAIGINRANSMAALMTVKAFTTGTLDTFSAAGVKQVGLIPEQLKAPKTTRDAYSKSFGFSGPGSRSTREELPSASTIFRITKNEQNIEADLEAEGDFIEVQTAGDDNVCQQCQDIEGDNPYTIDEARSLIPAHPNCRCAFVPVDDGSGGGFLGMVTSFFGNFFNAKTVADMNENHDPKTGQFAEGSGATGATGASGHDLSEISNVAFHMSHRSPEYVSAVVKRMLAEKLKPTVETIGPKQFDKLRATQFELNFPGEEGKVGKGIAVVPGLEKYLDKPIVIRENVTGILHVIDGHNRLSDAVRSGRSISVYQFEESDLEKSTLEAIAKKYPGASTIDAMTIDFNENHDPKTGQFSEGSGAAGGNLNKGISEKTIAGWKKKEAARGAKGKGFEQGREDFPHEPQHGGRIGTPAEMNKVIDDVTKQLGYNRSYMQLGKTEKFVLDGKERSSAASTSLWTLRTIISDACPMEQLSGTIAHEAMHAKFENYMRAYHSGQLPADMMAFHKSINFDELKKLDGVSAYSFDYWHTLGTGGAGNKGVGSSLKTAVHETLAEMARIQLDYGKPDLPGGVNSDWKKLYDNVNTFFSTRTNPKGLHT